MNIIKLANIRNKIIKVKKINNIKYLNKCEKYLNKLPVPQNLFENSFNQYLCQKFITKNFYLQNIIAKILFKKTKNNFLNSKVTKNDLIRKKPVALFFNQLGTSIIPDELKNNYDIIQCQLPNGILKNEDNIILAELEKKYKKHKFFIYKVMCKIAQYRELIETYSPNAIIATSEYSFTSSILTYFCNQNNVKHINIMHGEKLFDMTATFFCFNKCYVWDEAYIDLFKRQRALNNDFNIAIPESLKFNIVKAEKKIDYKFFIGNENKKELKLLKKAVSSLLMKGCSVIIREHPIFTTFNDLKKIFKEKLLEKYTSINIYESISETNFVVSRFSTVLYQAFLNGGNVIIDDITTPKHFKLLKDLGYIMINKKHKLLSNVCK